MIAALAVAALCAPGTFARTHVPTVPPTDIALTRVADASETGTPGWGIAGVWEYSSGPSRYFGGFSALLALDDHRLQAFSDRGVRFTFLEPDRPGQETALREVAIQYVAPGYSLRLWDIESATRHPETGEYWLGYEYFHAIHRFSAASEPEGVRDLEDEVDWPSNSGAEAMVRLEDGRFLVMGEGKNIALIYPSDPVAGAEPDRIEFKTPAESFVVTDLAQLPDGRVLLLMRNLVWGSPPFNSLIAIADAPDAAMDETWQPQVVLRFDNILPNENYEGLAVRPQEDGKVAVWAIADDNFSFQQRNLIVKLIFDPSA